MARILLINDDADLLDIAAIILSDAGHEVETALHARDVVAVVQRNKPDLVILDWVMPGVRGDEALRSLKAAHDTKAIPVLMMSALHGAGVASQRLGADGFLAKPFEAEELERAVAAVLARTKGSGGAGEEELGARGAG